MSHISKIETKIKDLSHLKKALETLGIAYIEASEETSLTVQGYGTDETIENCIMEINTGSKYGIGIRKNLDSYEIVADWWAIETFTGEKQDTILNRITRQYAYETVMDKVRDLGYSIVQEEQDTHSNVRLTVRKWA